MAKTKKSRIHLDASLFVDGKDREILRFMKSANRPVSGTAMTSKVGISVPAIKPRLEGLQSKGIIKKVKVGGNREFKRSFGSKIVDIKSPSKILWGLDINPRKDGSLIIKKKSR